MTDLTDRMRTCAAYVADLGVEIEPDTVSISLRCANDIVDLLIEASNALDELHSTGALRVPADLGEPMQIIEPLPKQDVQWVDPGIAKLPKVRATLNARACPKCDSRAIKRADREGNKLMLTCPVCGERWQYKPKAEWV